MAKRKAAARGKAPTRGPGRPVTTGIGQLVGLRCRTEFLEAVDMWRHSQASQAGGNVTPLSRPAAIVKLAEIALAGASRKSQATVYVSRGRQADD